MPGNPHFTWTAHARLRIAQRGVTWGEVERAIREGHAVRLPNHGRGDWRVDAGRFSVVYDHPDGDDWDAVRIVTVWVRRQR